MVTIEEIYKRGEINTLTRFLCKANKIKTFKDLRQHYLRSKTFSNLRYCDLESAAELMAVYDKYSDIYTEYEASQPMTRNKGETYLQDVVTDLDEVLETISAAEALFEELEQRLKNHWRKKGIRSVRRKPYVRKASESLEEIEQRLEKHWKKRGIRSVQRELNVSKARESLEEIEQRLEKHWKKKGMRSVQRESNVSKPRESLEEIEQRLKNYWEKKGIGIVQRESNVRKPRESLEEIEQRLKNYWEKKATETAEKDVVKRKSTFGRHPSKQLNRLYSIKNYQGANPVDAKVIFVGRDPNWAAGIEKMDMFGSVVEYLTDGISFWEKHGIHHPFLLKGYRGDGRRYHSNFSKMNLDSSMASKISFVELIGFPTTGMAGSNSTLLKQYLFSDANRDNLIQLDKVLNDPNKIIFIAWGLITNFEAIYKKTGLLKRFAEIDKRSLDRKQLNRVGNIYIHTHFSDAISSDMIAEMGGKVRGSLK